MNINDYVNLNLDKNDMTTPLTNLQTPGYYQDQMSMPSGTQMMDNLIQQMEQMPQSQPIVMSKNMGQLTMGQPMIGQPTMISQPMMGQPMMSQPTMMNQPTMSQPIFIPQKLLSEKTQAKIDLEISSNESTLEEKKPQEEQSLTPELKKKSFTAHLSDTILVVILYIIISNPYIASQIVTLVPFFETYPWAFYSLKIIMFGLLFHLIKWFK